ncbi:MAG: hypothetical protein KDA32_07125, partial [Phycisphaerales bacterium]|nr:hypothetical protein [Phycisphaerales bacterium]
MRADDHCLGQAGDFHHIRAAFRDQAPPDEDDRRERRRRRNWLLIGGSLILIVLGRVASAPRPEPTGYFTEVRLPLVIAHQGGDGHWPGNTMYAFRRAAQVGVDVLEMDVHRSSDGVLVLSHDATVDRTTNGSGRIDEQTWA